MNLFQIIININSFDGFIPGVGVRSHQLQVSHSDFLYIKFVLREEQSQSLRKKSQSQHTGSKSKLEFHTGAPRLVIIVL